MRKAALRIVEKLRLHGYETYFAGGWVRDLLLHRKPKDIDIATSAHPEVVTTLFSQTALVGAQFGVVQVRLYRRQFEVATFRQEGPYFDGRHPSSVSYACAREDAQRRDFTVNGLFFDPVRNEIIDYVGGQDDLARKILRTIGNAEERFGEDKLRMLRALRFACSLDFSLASETWEAIVKMAPQIKQTSWERIRDELLQIFTGPHPAQGLALLSESGLLAEILPEVAAMRGIEQPSEYHPEGDVFEHTRLALSLLRRRSPVLALATLLHDVGKPLTYSVRDRIRFDGHVDAGVQKAEEICRRLRLPNADIDAILSLVRHHLRFMHVHEMKESTLRRFLAMPHFKDHLELHRVDCLSSHRQMDSYSFCRKKLREIQHEPKPIAALLRGKDLIDLGYQPGPLFKEILRQVEDLQLEKALGTREEALDYVCRNYPRIGEPGTQKAGT
jgi:poly(A) polymerase